MLAVFWKIIIITFVVSFSACVSHTHTKGAKENVEDGNYIARDKDHFKDGEHDYEFDHESVLGSRQAAEEFHNLSPSEAKARLKLLAHKMDENEDSFVDRKELANWILRSYAMLTEEEAMQEMENEDGDGDGKVTWEEHIADVFGIMDDDMIGSVDKTSDDFQMLRNDKELFEAADVNKDGILDKSEFPAFSHPEEFERMYQVVYEQAMRKRDADKDGFLSFEEYVADTYGATPVSTTEQYIMEKDRFTHDYDLNNDNKLDKEEVLLMLIPNNIEAAETEADHLIGSSDSNKDGRLSVDEIVDHHEIFVGSEATDYGEQLKNIPRYTDEL
ncbi:Reticulocalbin-2, partial [Stegodyphus mimosarum]